jgi:predicted nucleic acid-binding protein
VKYLFDINVLLALAHQNHSDHQKVGIWFKSIASVATQFLTCSITELGFVRISVQAGLEPDVGSALRTLLIFKRSSKVPFELCSDSIGASVMPRYVKSRSQLTDGHLLELASISGAKLITLDKGIPGAVLIK